MGDKGMMAVGDEMGEGMQCSEHPYRNNPGGICAFCLQEKLGKLVSSSNSSSPFLSLPPQRSSSSSSPSFQSDYGGGGGSRSGAVGPVVGSFAAGGSGRERTKLPFLSATATHRKKSTIVSGGGARKVVTASSSSFSSTAASSVVVLKMSKSVAPRPMGGVTTDPTTAAAAAAAAADSPRKKSFWWFLYLSSSSSSTTATSAATSASSNKRRSTSSGSDSGSRDLKQHQPQQQEATAADPSKAQTKGTCSNVSKQEQDAVAESPGGSQASSSSFGRKVARSRSVGCGSRSFSGDFLERISTGFGDCTLRRVESLREANNNKHGNKMVLDRDEQRIKERVKCGGIFGGFGMMSSTTTYWLSAATGGGSGEDEFDTGIIRTGSSMARASSATVRGGGGRSKSWGWAFASPMRAFRPATSTSSSTKSYAHNNAISSINAAVIGYGGSINNGKLIDGGTGSNGKVDATTATNPSSLLAVTG